MPRSVNTVATRAKRKKFMKLAKGYFGRKKNVWTVSKNAIEKGLGYAYRDRKCKKRTNRQKWIITINAALKDKNIKYNTFIKALNLKNIQINRKIMYMLIKNNITLFNTIIENTCT